MPATRHAPPYWPIVFLDGRDLRLAMTVGWGIEEGVKPQRTSMEQLSPMLGRETTIRASDAKRGFSRPAK